MLGAIVGDIVGSVPPLAGEHSAEEIRQIAAGLE